jgi:hypothetical protein
MLRGGAQKNGQLLSRLKLFGGGPHTNQSTTLYIYTHWLFNMCHLSSFLAVYIFPSAALALVRSIFFVVSLYVFRFAFFEQVCNYECSGDLSPKACL